MGRKLKLRKWSCGSRVIGTCLWEAAVVNRELQLINCGFLGVWSMRCAKEIRHQSYRLLLIWSAPILVPSLHPQFQLVSQLLLSTWESQRQAFMMDWSVKMRERKRDNRERDSCMQTTVAWWLWMVSTERTKCPGCRSVARNSIR